MRVPVPVPTRLTRTTSNGAVRVRPHRAVTWWRPMLDRAGAQLGLEPTTRARNGVPNRDFLDRQLDRPLGRTTQPRCGHVPAGIDRGVAESKRGVLGNRLRRRWRRRRRWRWRRGREIDHWRRRWRRGREVWRRREGDHRRWRRRDHWRRWRRRDDRRRRRREGHHWWWRGRVSTGGGGGKVNSGGGGSGGNEGRVITGGGSGVTNVGTTRVGKSSRRGTGVSTAVGQGGSCAGPSGTTAVGTPGSGMHSRPTTATVPGGQDGGARIGSPTAAEAAGKPATARAMIAATAPVVRGSHAPGEMLPPRGGAPMRRAYLPEDVCISGCLQFLILAPARCA